ncbi:hypothetical protein ACEF17_11845, partial [Streptococcus hyovaginalis]
CGKWSITVAPVCVITAAAIGATPVFKIASENEPVAKITPVEVDAVAAAIKVPAIGARNVPEMPDDSTKATTCEGKSEAVINPPIEPAPILIQMVGVILFKPAFQ